MSWFNLWKAPEQNDSPPATNETTKPNNTGGLRIGEMRGGAGGKGGSGEGFGGKGGQGGEAKIKHGGRGANMDIGKFEGGAGGEGGTGNKQAGAGGGGGGAEIEREEEPLLSQTRLPGPNMNIEEFGAKYHLSDTTVAQLSNFGYDTAGSVRFATAADLKKDGFKQGHINQLRHALDTWSPKT